ncbi:hypothetical protein [Brazilian marseillevirus]|uniref:hypothetical protein n=1 Tax=Brazilian marseillevirus TaxID=1813599 RepID=UPI0007838D14|nr:hypothetical protein A3303_gp053 [Brazilian marseillevirus]AMQ10561.1 hypothetical protein [Brazilian marseillevirus]
MDKFNLELYPLYNMELERLVFSHPFADRETVYGVVSEVDGTRAKIRPLPCVSRKLFGKTRSCSPDWEKIEETLKEEDRFMWVNIGWNKKKPFLETKGRIMNLCDEEDEVDLFTP